MIHDTIHPMSGARVRIKMKTPDRTLDGLEHDFRIEDWADRVMGRSIWDSAGNFAIMNYAMRRPDAMASFSDECVYGKVDGLGYIIHTDEIVEEAK